VTASVTDTGAGMTAEQIAHAGQLFYSTKAEGKGSGLDWPWRSTSSCSTAAL